LTYKKILKKEKEKKEKEKKRKRKKKKKKKKEKEKRIHKVELPALYRYYMLMFHYM
jgi:hypothetical protein